MLQILRGPRIELQIAAACALANVFTALVWFDLFGETFGPLANVVSILFMVVATLPTVMTILTLQVAILKRTLLRFDFFFNQWNAIQAGVWHSFVLQRLFVAQMLVRVRMHVVFRLYHGQQPRHPTPMLDAHPP
jgi:hypothetical protein